MMGPSNCRLLRYVCVFGLCGCGLLAACEQDPSGGALYLKPQTCNPKLKTQTLNPKPEAQKPKFQT